MRLNSGPTVALAATVAALVAGCGAQPIAQSDSHLRQDPARTAAATSSIPRPVRPAPLPPPPEARAAEIKYSIVVSNQPVRDVLLAIARETQVNVDIHPGVEGAVTINAIDQTLKQILTRIAKQIDMRFEIDEQTIHVMPDSPFLRNYRVDYVNMARDTTETVAISTQVISGATRHRRRREARRARTTPRCGSATPRATVSGRRSRRTSRTCCARRTSSCPRAAARRS